MARKNHLPMYGVGPIYVFTIFVLAIASMALSQKKIFLCGDCENFKIIFYVVAAIFAVIGVMLCFFANFKSRLGDGILKNHLITTGVFAWVRNPMYSAFTFFATSLVLLAHNLLLLIMPLIFWAMLTALMKLTEEKWLYNLYGDEYKEYCKRTNRCIPWFPKK